MRILHVMGLMSPDGAYGGPARVALNQSAELIDLGHEVTVAAATRGYAVPPTEHNGVPLRLFPARTVLPATGFPGTAAPGLSKWLHDNAAGFDVIHIHFGRDLVTLPAAAAARRSGIPYVLQTHGMVVPSNHPLARPLDRVWTRRLLRDAKAVLFLTEQERDQLGAVARGPLRLTQLGNGVPDYPGADAGSGPPEVLFVARMHSRKRPLVFVEMAKALLAEGLDARFTLVGPDEGEGDALREAVAGDPRISWEGALDPDEVPPRMALASIYVLPSVREPYPMAVLEAMSAGLPVVVAADCGLAPMVERAHCGIVTEGPARAYGVAVKEILSDQAMAAEMGRQAQRTARAEFGMRRIGERLVRVYREARRGC